MMESSQKVNDEIMDSLREIDRLCHVRMYLIERNASISNIDDINSRIKIEHNKIVELEGASHESA